MLVRTIVRPTRWWFLHPAAGVLLLTVFAATGHAQVRRGAADAADEKSAESTPAEEAKAALQRLRSVLEEKDFVEFVEWFAPVDDLREIRAANAVERAADSLNEWPHRTKMMAMLEYLEDQSPVFDPSGAVATYEVDITLGALSEDGDDAGAAATTKPEELDVRDVPGLNGDLADVLSSAAALLEEEQVEEFVEHMFPLEEVARMKKEETLDGLIERLDEHPDMVETMIDDLYVAAAVKPEFDDSGDVARIALPSPRRGGEDRELFFEKANGHWRFDNQAGKIRGSVAEQLLNAPVGGGAAYEFQLERIGDHWRLVEFPEFVSEIVLPE